MKVYFWLAATPLHGLSSPAGLVSKRMGCQQQSGGMRCDCTRTLRIQTTYWQYDPERMGWTVVHGEERAAVARQRSGT
jgi:hypothetical protein